MVCIGPPDRKKQRMASCDDTAMEVGVRFAGKRLRRTASSESLNGNKRLCFQEVEPVASRKRRMVDLNQPIKTQVRRMDYECILGEASNASLTPGDIPRAACVFENYDIDWNALTVGLGFEEADFGDLNDTYAFESSYWRTRTVLTVWVKIAGKKGSVKPATFQSLIDAFQNNCRILEQDNTERLIGQLNCLSIGDR